MRPIGSFDYEQDVVYFAPGQLLFLVEHDEPLGPDALIEAVQAHPLVRGDDCLARVRFDAQRVWTIAPREDTSDRKQAQLPSRRLSHALLGRRPPAALPGEKSDRRGRAYSTLFADLDLDDARLLELVEELDRRLQAGDDRGVAGVMLRTVSPNWLASGAPYHIGTGGPGAQPVPARLPSPAWWSTAAVDTPGTPFSFRLPGRLGSTSAGDGVEVAILDTAPTPEELKKAFDRWQSEHPILRGLLAPNGTLPSSRLRLSPGDGALFARLNSEDGGFQLGAHRYRMADHGLFVAGIIHSIAPRADLHLVRVLNDFGVGTLETIVQGLHTVYQQRDPARPLLVNMSLTLSLPLRGHKLPRLGPARLFADPAFIERMGWPVAWACEALESEDVLIVAAAGNDAQPGNRPHARQPAALDSVIGVGALRSDGSPADYSNLADRPSRIGIATFGGDASPGGPADPEQGVLGVYIGAFPDGERNENGWARWAGTSFAAPAITGVLARLRSTVYSPEDALRKVYEAQFEVTPSPAEEEVLTIRQG